MKVNFHEMVRCPLCDRDFEIFGTHTVDAYLHARSKYTVLVAPDEPFGHQQCPLCKGDGKITAALWSAFQLRFAGETYRLIDDIIELYYEFHGSTVDERRF